MYFLLNQKKKIIFGWTPKCGCSHVKNLWFYLNNMKVNYLHDETYISRLPKDINNYIIIIFTRNPYKRLVSGFLDKYKKNGQFRFKWGKKEIIFKDFVDVLVQKNYSRIERHHFSPQTSELYDKSIFKSKTLKFYDICNIDYAYIEKLFNKNIEKHIIDFKGKHLRSLFVKKEHDNQYVYNLNMDTYYLSKIDTKYFYNEEIKKKVFNHYKEDFITFYENGIDYINSPF